MLTSLSHRKPDPELIIIRCTLCKEATSNIQTLFCLHPFCVHCLPKVRTMEDRGADGIICPKCFTFSRQDKPKSESRASTGKESLSDRLTKPDSTLSSTGKSTTLSSTGGKSMTLSSTGKSTKSFDSRSLSDMSTGEHMYVPPLEHYLSPTPESYHGNSSDSSSNVDFYDNGAKPRIIYGNISETRKDYGNSSETRTDYGRNNSNFAINKQAVLKRVNENYISGSYDYGNTSTPKEKSNIKLVHKSCSNFTESSASVDFGVQTSLEDSDHSKTNISSNVDSPLYQYDTKTETHINELESEIGYYEEQVAKLKQSYQSCKEQYLSIFNSFVQEAKRQLQENLKLLEHNYTENSRKITQAVHSIRDEIINMQCGTRSSDHSDNSGVKSDSKEVNIMFPLLKENNQLKITVNDKRPLLGITVYESVLLSYTNRSFWESSRHYIGSLSEVLQNMSNKQDLVKLQAEKGYRINMVNDEIWLASNDEHDRRISIFSPASGEKVKEIKCARINTPKSIQQVSRGSVIVASHNGLHVVNTSGRYMYRIRAGHYTDVAADRSTVAAIASGNRRVGILNQVNERWQVQRQFTLHDPDERLKTLHVADNIVYICVHFHSMVYKYNLQGELLAEYGSSIHGTISKGGELTSFSAPFITGTDNKGSVIVCDRNNCCIQIMDPRGVWQRMNTSGVTWPIDLLVVENSVFILWENEKYVKYLSRLQFR